VSDATGLTAQEQATRRRAWVDQLHEELNRRSAREAVHLIARRTAGAPAFVGLDRHRARARLLETRELADGDVDATLAELKGWLDEVTAATSHAEAAMTGGDKAAAPERLRILVVDDDPVQRALIGRRLGTLGHEVTLAENGREAIRVGLSASFDVLLMDRMLPDLDGPRVLMVLRQRGVTTPAALLTASPTDVDGLVGPAGIDLVLQKPVTAAQLAGALAELVH
jgi:CheY-like chemotaxis protein